MGMSAADLQSTNLQTTDLQITGMTCAACVRRVERAIAAVPGVASVAVNLATARARVTGGSDMAALIGAVHRAGYAAAAPTRAAPADDPAWPVWLAVGFAAPLALGMIVHLAGGPMLPGWVQFALAAPVEFWLGWRFHAAGWRAVRAGAGNMDLLVSIGTLAAFALSTASLLNGGTDLYFESAALVIAFVLVGKRLEAGARRHTGDALRALAALRPETANRLRDGAEEAVPLAAVAVGDLLVVRPGERIPVDGTVTAGTASIDRAVLTGESLPAPIAPGEAVSAGTLDLDGQLTVRATGIGADTLIARIIRLVEDAQATKPPIQRLVDRVSAVFVPVVLVIAVATFAAWWAIGGGAAHALVVAVSVLVIACPCALGLATPAAIVVGTGAAARAGILFRDAATLERAAAVTAVAFDKTGTLTEGVLRVADIVPTAGTARDAVLRAAASLQQGSVHPIARAIRAAAANETLEPAEDFRALAGRGVQARVGGVAMLLGTEALMRENAIDCTPLLAAAGAQRAQGRSIAFLAADGRLLGLIACADTPREDAAAAVAALADASIATVMLTGDNAGAAASVGTSVGIADLRANLLPQDKAAAIADLRAAGAVVAMVGDGVNDAPALAAADIGIVVAGGADAALASAGIGLLRADPRLVPAALALARRTRGTIRAGLFWAFAYNAVGIPLAAAGLLSPVIAGAAMGFSSAAVVLNALRLRTAAR
jgi:Cu+-exporting ATPase